MARAMAFWFLVLLLVTLNPTWLTWSGGAAKATSASTFQFLERPNAERDRSWSHLLPTNFYSEMNQQYYRRFRRQTGMMNRLGSGQLWRFPFENDRYV
ncbi:uncharacterized protein LOC108088102 [Drosophila ficusphila]|uniref:uncharacterized protein LOC108088102 n=1 Tax=Drosophila ficusphila TaxID=30025 RepID=UPI0007E6A9E6|nr:uncharacterized protein LOC108088102 [Drosophila ficusphila]